MNSEILCPVYYKTRRNTSASSGTLRPFLGRNGGDDGLCLAFFHVSGHFKLHSTTTTLLEHLSSRFSTQHREYSLRLQAEDSENRKIKSNASGNMVVVIPHATGTTGQVKPSTINKQGSDIDFYL